MSVLSWGKPIVEIAPYVNGELPASPAWVALAEIQQGSAQLDTEQGEKQEALDEGGEVVDVRFGKNKYTFTCALFIKKGDSKPISDVDGVVTTNYALRLTPEDGSTQGFILPKCSVQIQESWTSADGGLWTLTFSALKPAAGTMLQRYSAGFSVSPLHFDVPKSATTRTIHVVSATQPTAAASSGASWLTPTVSGEAGNYEVAVAVSANTGSARTGDVIITVSGNSQSVSFAQAAGN